MAKDKRPGVAAVLAVLYPEEESQVNTFFSIDFTTEDSKSQTNTAAIQVKKEEKVGNTGKQDKKKTNSGNVGKESLDENVVDDPTPAPTVKQPAKAAKKMPQVQVLHYLMTCLNKYAYCLLLRFSQELRWLLLRKHIQDQE